MTTHAIESARANAINWAKDPDTLGSVAEFGTAAIAAQHAKALEAEGYEVSRSDDRADNDDGIARRWWVWIAA